MADPVIVILERQSRWAPILRRELAGSAYDLRETRSPAATREVLSSHPGSFLLVQLTPQDLDQQIELLVWLTANDPLACATCAGEPEYVKLALEAGAVAHVATRLEWKPLVRVARRHLRRATFHAWGDESPEGLHSAWRSRLPWPQLPGIVPHLSSNPEENQP